jgi:PiT family inorganic phosphate transporter
MALILSPILGTAVGFIFMLILYRIFRNSAPSGLNKNFRRMQIARQP